MSREGSCSFSCRQAKEDPRRVYTFELEYQSKYQTPHVLLSSPVPGRAQGRKINL